MQGHPELTIVLTVFDEAPSLRELHGRLCRVLAGLGRSFEILFVNDGSRDGSGEILSELAAEDARVGVIDFRRNFGKAAALDAGFRQARGRIVITMDADLQDDPDEIPRMLQALDSGLDLVSGWKKERHDPLDKTLPSKLFNRVVGLASGLRLHDFNCGFKAYRAEALKGLDLYGELHRFIPVLVYWRGFSVGEIPVRHHPRRFGRSKYGWSRLVKGLFDLMTVLLNTRYRARPLHLFGGVGLLSAGLGGLILAYLLALWIVGLGPIGTRPLLFLGLLLVVVGIQLVSTGLLGELINRTQQAEKPHYVIRSVKRPIRLERQRRRA